MRKNQNGTVAASLAAAAPVVLMAASAFAQPVDAFYASPTYDRWNYPFNVTPGTRTVATTFGSGFIPNQFDDRDAQFLNSFITAGDIAPGLGASNYQIIRATFTATLVFGTFAYSDTYNPGSFGTPGTSIDLFGTGFRNGFNAFAFGENGPWGFGDPTSEDIRNAFATDNLGGSNRDISNELRDGLTAVPFATGVIAGATSGTSVTAAGQLVTFELNLSNPDVISYLQNSLNSGILSLSVSSLHAAAQPGQPGELAFPGFATKENTAFGPSTLDLGVRIIPSPASAGVLMMGGLLAARRRR
jgi:hypothetical protein